MTTVAIRALAVCLTAGIACAAGASPAVAAGDPGAAAGGTAAAADRTAVAAEGTEFELSAGRVTATGIYDLAMSIPERPVPPVVVSGTLANYGRTGCGVVQLAANGPADEIVWPTLAYVCGPGRTAFQARSAYLFGGAKPPLRLCVGPTLAHAESGRHCDVYTPPPDL
ncbi:hypothetical protein [Couchioplanes azureus]|uniref:hypothetical protein n=1 Tax=Couchioplanes caeruleus TaxID=56438 RepID=UPI001670E243|nr:hypothetical protein [Couchioplanes caeruleus]GGQ73611.1 hypothetical protein GCM10010166_49650 [Couchioplanes caeruleus subsp. azureus]